MTRELAVAVGVAVEVEVLVEAKASVFYQAIFLVGQKTGALCARFHLPRHLRP